MNVMGVTGNDPLQANGPIELYLEGNIVFRQGDRLIYADRMFYNATQEYGVVLAAEMLTPVQDYQGLVRLKADVLQQIDKQNFQAYGAAVTTSRLGVPRYWLQSERITFEDRQRWPPIPTAARWALIQPQASRRWSTICSPPAATTSSTLGRSPCSIGRSWRAISASPRSTSTGLTVKSDTIFGQQILVDYDTVSAARHSSRHRRHRLDTLQRLPQRARTRRRHAVRIQPARTFSAFGGPSDRLHRCLGRVRPRHRRRAWPAIASACRSREERGRLLARHRQDLPNDCRFSGEIGLISDRNFLEQYFEREWDQQKDYTTGLELKKFLENGTLAISADFRPNSSFTQTERLPRLDHFVLGQDLACGWLTWHAHSLVGYEHLRRLVRRPAADIPTSPPSNSCPGNTIAKGLRAITRHEIDLAVASRSGKGGALRARRGGLLGRRSHRQRDQPTLRSGRHPRQPADVASESRRSQRTVQPQRTRAQDRVWKPTSSTPMPARTSIEFPLYDPLDDDAQEFARRRSLFRTFGLTFGDQIPLQYDGSQLRLPQRTAGLGHFAHARDCRRSHDGPRSACGIAGKPSVARSDAKRSSIGSRSMPAPRCFPMPTAITSAKRLGMVNYDFNWHVGDRFTLLSDGFADVFDQGLRQITVGANLGRPESGNLFLAARSTEGPISSNVLHGVRELPHVGEVDRERRSGVRFGQHRQHRSIRWASPASARHSWLTTNVNYDASRQSLGVTFGLEPRFLPRGRAGFVNGVRVPPAGTFGLE